MNAPRSNITSIFDELFDAQEAANLKIRSKLMTRLALYMDEHELTQQQAAERFDVGQPRVSQLVNGQIGKFTIDALVNMCHAVGINVAIDFDDAYAGTEEG